MNTNRTTIVILLTIYLVSLFFFMGAIGEDVLIGDVTATSQNLGIDSEFLGMEIGFGNTFLGNIVTSIDILPLWFNTIFIVIPSVILIVFAIMMFIPTIPSG